MVDKKDKEVDRVDKRDKEGKKVVDIFVGVVVAD